MTTQESNWFAHSHIVSGQCGIGAWSGFGERINVEHRVGKDMYGNTYPPEYYIFNGHRTHPMLPGKHRGGCGFSGTGFIPTQACKEVYEHMCKHFRLVFQTPVRKNKNSNNMFFYAMFDDGPNDDIATIEPKWPF